jgi:hypothetical protein
MHVIRDEQEAVARPYTSLTADRLPTEEERTP